MPEITIDQGKSGIKGATNQRLDIVLNQPSIEILIGGPYTSNGETHTYGHVALRTIKTASERVYDFGRYGKYNGPVGDGILRVWTNFNDYISGENFLERETTGFLYSATVEQIEKIDAHYDEIIKSATKYKSRPPSMMAYKLPKDYNAIDNNCTTVSLGGARIALPRIEYNTPTYNDGRGMSSSEKLAARAANFGSWPDHVFMPADLQMMLKSNSVHKPLKIITYGGKKTR